ncbi:MAG: hypothetical protein QW128_01530 [Thermoprotei archaeon]
MERFTVVPESLLMKLLRLRQIIIKRYVNYPTTELACTVLKFLCKN